MISAAHAAAMQAGRERQLAEEEAARAARHDIYRSWVRRDARLWRAYSCAVDIGADAKAAYREWKTNLNAMPELP